MVGNVYHLWDGSKWTQYESISDAEGAADEAIDAARDCCDPEWPLWVGEIAVYLAPPEIEDPNEGGICVLYAHEYLIDPPAEYEDCGDVDYWANYSMKEAE